MARWRSLSDNRIFAQETLMSGFVTLTCPSCGGKLQITNDIDRFACGHCGNEHVVKRSGGVVALAPVVEGLAKVQVGVDKTASELEVARIERELAVLYSDSEASIALVEERLAAWERHFEDPGWKWWGLLAIVSGIAAVANIPNIRPDGNPITALLLGAVAAAFALISAVTNRRSTRAAAECFAAANTADADVARLDEDILCKEEELEQYRQMVSTK
jgi:predicted RNA-binding Zn-ribbon protein involved in translation (DUF1610 family)